MTDLDPDFARTVDADIISKPRAVIPERLLSLDVVRGLTIAFMIIVNNQIGRAPFYELSHAAWNGFTATDLVFPTFLLLVGLSTVLSTASRMARGASRSEIFLHTLRRAALLFVFGFVVNNFPYFHLSTARYYGVLPRIAVCYLIVATLYLVSRSWKNMAVLAVVCLIGYWILLRFVPVPGFGVPTHEVAINDPNGNLTAYLDRRIFSAPHLYERTRDPEGLLSTLPALATALFGVLAGLWLRTNVAMQRKAAMLALAGVLFLAVALAWNPFFPINKKLWTSSYALYAGGWSLLLLALAIYVIDVKRVGRRVTETNDPGSPAHPLLYRPLLVFGTNAILAYMVSELGEGVLRLIHPVPGRDLKQVVWQGISSVVAHPGWASLVYSLWFMVLCWLIVLPLYRKRIFLRI